jgi:hypothetical protein
MSDEFEKYDTFAKQMEERFPKIFAEPYGGFCCGEGWWPVIEALCGQIDSYTKWRNNTREALLKNNPHNLEIPDAVPQVVVAQIKEKFGGLRFYYDGGDEQIRGMVSMAESWAGHSCETCGSPGKRRDGGWIRTLCDHHEEMHKINKRKYEDQASQ